MVVTQSKLQHKHIVSNISKPEPGPKQICPRASYIITSASVITADDLQHCRRHMQYTDDSYSNVRWMNE